MTDALFQSTPEAMAEPDHPDRQASLAAAVKAGLGQRSLVLVGMMGAGKTSVGKRLAAVLDMPFVDADRKSTRLNSSHVSESRMPSSA
mgnify:CR=1 FL=1